MAEIGWNYTGALCGPPRFYKTCAAPGKKRKSSADGLKAIGDAPKKRWAAYHNEEDGMSIDEKDLLKVGAEAALNPFASLIERLFGGAVDQIGSGWEDSLKIRRRIRQLKLLTKLKARIEQAGFEPHPIPTTFGFPHLRPPHVRTDYRLQDKWASLPANASNPNTGIDPDSCKSSTTLRRSMPSYWTRSTRGCWPVFAIRGYIQIVYSDHDGTNDVLWNCEGKMGVMSDAAKTVGSVGSFRSEH